MPKIPGRAFLDTSVVNFIFDYGEQIHDGMQPLNGLPKHDKDDINALYNIFFTGKRASWQLAISPFTYHEVIKTRNPSRRNNLEKWIFEIWEYWREIISHNDDLPSFIEAEDLRIRILGSAILDTLPDFNDRVLIVDALVYRCDCFCTRDRKTILKHRESLNDLGLPIVSPSEWWGMIKPYASLWA